MNFSDIEQIDLAERWRRWPEPMELYLRLNMAESAEKEQCDAFRYIIGQDGRDIYNTMAFTVHEVDKIDILFAKFEEYCKPRKNIIMERYKFNTRVQRKNETADQYVTELKLIAKNCNFGSLKDELIRNRLVYGTNSERIKERLLRGEEELTLVKALKICRADEQSNKQLKAMNGENETDSKSKNFAKRDDKQQEFKCKNCGKSHASKQCPAYGKTCFNCGKNDHFSKVCRAKRKVGLVEQDKSKEHLEPLFIGAVNYSSSKSNNNDEDEYFKTLVMQDKQIQFKIDTGSQANILPVTTFRSLKDVQLETTAVKLTSYTGEHLPVLGQCYLKYNDKILKFFVVDTKQVPILGLQTSKDLNLIKLVMNVKLSKRENTTAKSVNDMASQFPKVFQGLGCLKKPYHIQVDPKVTSTSCEHIEEST
ncbi:Transposon Ty3-G Gag-Pol poly, partial [Paramuricea clavata]